LATGDTPPVIGARRRPGTLPIESWLLLGRHRQQALLAAIVAAGLILISIPTQQQRTTDLEAVNASQRGAAAAAAAANGGVPPTTGKATKPAQNDDASAEPAAPSASTTGRPATVEPAPGRPSAPVEGVPEPSATTKPGQSAASLDRRGSGPAESLRRTGTSTVALTFDDGPDPVQTPKLLDLLEKNGVTATFCLVGKQAKAHPEIVRRIVADGHRLCNHSWDHSLTLGKQKPEDIREDLSKTNDAIRAAVPDAQIPYFRAPGGNFTDALVGAADDLAMTSLYWEVDPRDWARPGDEDDAEHVDRVVAEVEKHVRNGSIVLSHDYNQPQTIVAYETLLPWLTERFTLGLP
jgi:peptidoglycan/xylan/chitin deacetylase (PgdA/CDA1 family)